MNQPSRRVLLAEALEQTAKRFDYRSHALALLLREASEELHNADDAITRSRRSFERGRMNRAS